MLTARIIRLPIVLLAICGTAALQASVWAQPAATPAAPAQTPAQTPAQAPAKESSTHKGTVKVVKPNIFPPVDPMDSNRYGVKQPPARVAGEVRIATYNLENLFDEQDDPNLKDRYEDKTMTKPKAHCEALAKAIRTVNADILAVQEIESKEALLWFRDTWLKDMGYQYVSAIDAGDERGIEQGVLSRFPITNEQNWPKLDLGATGPAGTPLDGEALTFHRSPLRVDIQIPGSAGGAGAAPYELTLFVVHQKSGKNWGWFREIESKKIQSLVLEAMGPQAVANVVVLGDFNATSADESFKSYIAGGLINLFQNRDSGRDPKYVTHASGRAIDHILVSRGMSEEFNRDTRFVLSTPILPEGADFNLSKDLPGYAADHFPVVFDLRPSNVDRAPAELKAPVRAPASAAPATRSN